MPWSEVTDICHLAMLDVQEEWWRVDKNRQNGYKMLHCCWECIIAPLSCKFHFLLPFELLYPWETSVSISKDIIFTLRIGLCLYQKLPLPRTSLVAQTVKCLPIMWETRVNPWVRKMIWRRKWHPTPVFLPGKSHGQRNLVGYSPCGPKELDTTEQLHFHNATCEISVSWPGTEPRPRQWKHWILTTRPPGNSQGIIIFF